MARPRVGYTIELEKEVLWNIFDMSVSATAKSFGIDNWMVADIVHHRVEDAKKENGPVEFDQDPCGRDLIQ